MNQLSALIVDDEVHGRKNLANLIATHCPDIKVNGFASNAKEAGAIIKKEEPDVVFLDIMMPGMNGLDFLDSIPERNFAAILVTAYSDFGIKAVKAGVVDYLVKPIEIAELKKCVPKILSYIARTKRIVAKELKEQQRILITHLNGFSVVELDEIVYLQADDNYCTVLLADGKKLTVSKTLKEFDDQPTLIGNHFFRIHKSFLINLRHVREYINSEGGIILMSNGNRVPVARRKFEEFFKELQQLAIIS